MHTECAKRKERERCLLYWKKIFDPIIGPLGVQVKTERFIH